MGTRRNDALPLARRDPLALEIQAVLEADLKDGAKLMLPAYRAYALEERTLDGYCAAAAAAYFFLGGGREAGLQPMQHTHEHGSHWWIVRDDRHIVDLTLRPRERPLDFPWELGQPRGFMQTGYKRPSRRAQTIMDRVEARR